METPMTVTIISKENIKPSSPTPENQKHLQFSLLDQLALPVYVPLLLFYTTTPDIPHLKLSLSEALTPFYPLAGRVQDNNESIFCNDEGAIFLEARFNGGHLSDFLKHLNFDLLEKFLPFDIASSSQGCVLLVQTTSFDCGGTAIGLLMSHKISDASSISAFVKTWTATARGSTSPELPQFVGACVLPPPEGSPMATPTSDSGIHAKGVTKRLVFPPPKLAELKAKIAEKTGKNPTRVEAVSGLIWKSAIDASTSASGFSKPSVLGQAVNLRKRLEPPLPENSIGNLLGFITPETAAEGKIELQSLVCLLKEEIAEFNENGFKRHQNTEAFLGYLKTIMAPDGPYGGEKKFYLCSSWCRFPFYEADFGCGCPVWYVGGISMFSNFFLLMDAKDGEGIEVLVSLIEPEMAVFERDEELLAFASFNLNVM